MTFLELCNKRFSARKYTDEAVSEEDIAYIMECVRMAPSAVNRQPWKFIIITSDEGKEKIRQCYDRPWFVSAPVYVLCMKASDECWVRKDGKAHGDIDVAIAAEHICLAAADRGLGSCWVCNYDSEIMQRLFPAEGYEAVAIIPIGHAAADCPHPAKKRKSISEICVRA